MMHRASPELQVRDVVVLGPGAAVMTSPFPLSRANFVNNRFLDHIYVIDPSLHGYIHCVAWAPSFPYGRYH